jgi:addiction module RelE/StbE family toxin
MAVRWTKRALASFAAIAAHTERDNPSRATSFVKEIRAKTETLADFPGIGLPGRVAGTREFVAHENYIVPYRVRAGHVDIITFQHVAKRWPAVFDGTTGASSPRSTRR